MFESCPGRSGRGFFWVFVVTVSKSVSALLPLNNNTPVNTEVLWGGGLWWGLLRTSAPTAKHVQQVLDVDDTVAVCVTHA